MIIDYKKEEVFTKSVDIVDVGNFALQCVSGNGEEYYIIVVTVMGKTSVLKFGPVIPDLPVLCDGYNVAFKTFNFKEASILKEANLFINDYKKEIDEVSVITEYEALNNIPTITEDSLVQ